MIPGESINLRALERHDADLLYRWFNDAAVMSGWGWSAPARSMHVVVNQIEDWLGCEVALGRPQALVAESLQGECVGLVVLQSDRPEARSVELSLLVDADHWNHGYGRDILQTALDACFAGWGLHRVGVRVEEKNERALALYYSSGFKDEGRLRQAAFREGRHTDILLLGILADEWIAREDLATGRG